jgi:tetratricopeptide (TPR) repeat protein
MAAIQETRYDAAVSHYAKSVQSNPKNSSNYFLQAIALALAGRSTEASPLVQHGLALEPAFGYRWFYEYATRQIADRLAEGALLLGLPK